MLRREKVANVAVSSQIIPMCRELTTNFAYVRFHGLDGGAAHDYTDRELRPWATFLRDCAKRDVAAFVYFNNDMNTGAPFNALRLMEFRWMARAQRFSDFTELLDWLVTRRFLPLRQKRLRAAWRAALRGGTITNRRSATGSRNP